MFKSTRLFFLALVFAPLLMAAQCSQDQANTTLQDIQNQIKATCNYLPTIESIAAVAATVTSAVAPGAGATAVVAVNIGNVVAADICKAVQTQAGKMSAPLKGEQTMDVVVNGVTVHGTYTPAGK